MNKREIGENQEKRAAEYLKSLGFEILEQNFRSRLGEIDIIAKEGEMLCFVEVKYRSGRSQGLPSEAVDQRKQQKISSAAAYYLMKKGLGEWTPCRFDVVSLSPDHAELIRNAFEFTL